MKPHPCYDFPVNVEEDLEDGSNLDDLYRDIFRVKLNNMLDIVFVPEFGWQAVAWPPPMTQSSEGEKAVVATVQQARRIVAESLYTVTPHAQMAGKAVAYESEGFTMPDGQVFGPSPNIMFFVAPEVFAHYLDELHALVGQVPSRHDGPPVSQLQHYDVVKYLLDQVITSPYFLDRDRHFLDR